MHVHVPSSCASQPRLLVVSSVTSWLPAVDPCEPCGPRAVFGRTITPYAKDAVLSFTLPPPD
jgi:hypothetical protein